MSPILRTFFARYALPADDLLLRLTPTITVEGSPTLEDPDYPITNWDFNKPSKPAKFLGRSIQILFDFGAPANVAAFSLIYANLDPGLPCSLRWGSTSA